MAVPVSAKGKTVANGANGMARWCRSVCELSSSQGRDQVCQDAAAFQERLTTSVSSPDLRLFGSCR
jgi:hypothetical protein